MSASVQVMRWEHREEGLEERLREVGNGDRNLTFQENVEVGQRS
jgi:hypothetical protein